MLLGKETPAIFRLNRRGNETWFTGITPQATSDLGTSPILSSQRVLEAIFSRGVVVCEADSDRSVYGAVAMRQGGFSSQILFVHAHNKQTLKTVISLLRAAAIPVVAIADLDILNSESELRQTLFAFGAIEDWESIRQVQSSLIEFVNGHSDSDILHDSAKQLSSLIAEMNDGAHDLAGMRGAISRIKADASKWGKIKKRGLDSLESDMRRSVSDLIDRAKRHGLFIVPVGELESWHDWGVRKNRWPLKALEEISAGRVPLALEEFVGEAVAALNR
jgi:hypothetical protein